jgi:hypothetical protein
MRTFRRGILSLYVFALSSIQAMELAISPLIDLPAELRKNHVYQNLDEPSLFGRLTEVNKLLNSEIKEYTGCYYGMDHKRGCVNKYLRTSAEIPLTDCIIDIFIKPFKQYLQSPVLEPSSIIISEASSEHPNIFTFATIAKIVHTQSNNRTSIKFENAKEGTELYRMIGSRLLLHGTCAVSNNQQPSLEITRCQLKGRGFLFNNDDDAVTYCANKSCTALLISEYEYEGRILYMINASDPYKQKKMAFKPLYRR